MQYKLRRHLLKLFPERKTSFESDLQIAVKDHPGYNDAKLYEELTNRYAYARKQATEAAKKIETTTPTE